jgi:hypothetical protein
LRLARVGPSMFLTGSMAPTFQNLVACAKDLFTRLWSTFAARGVELPKMEVVVTETEHHLHAVVAVSTKGDR